MKKKSASRFCCRPGTRACWLVFVVTVCTVVVFPESVSAAYPAPLLWKTADECPQGYDYCGGLEFCSRGTNPYDRQYGYRLNPQDECSFPGPLLRLQAGSKYKFTLWNTSLDPTNIHTHGLHIVGDGDSDDVTRRVDGKNRFAPSLQEETGNCLEYTWDVGYDHPGGTYWYHSHYHGLSLQQVSGGGFGMLIVQDNLQLNLHIPKWMTHPTSEVLLQISYHDYDASVYGNGNYQEILELLPDQWYRLRISIVNPNAISQELVFHQSSSSSTVVEDVVLECDVYQVASDGIWSSKIPQNKQSVFTLTGASRADFAIRCPSWTDNGAADDEITSYDITYDGKVAATLQIPKSTTSSSSTSSTKTTSTTGQRRQLDEEVVPNKNNELEEWIPNRPMSLMGLMDDSATTMPVEQTFTIAMTSQTINGQYWDPDYALADLQYNQVYEWTLRNTHKHPFHLHLYHMMIVTPGGCGPAHVEGEFYDTISATLQEGETSTECKVRFKTADFGQRCVMHCHTMEHGDNGSMAWVNVIGGSEMPLNQVISPQYKCSSIDGGPTTTVPSASPSLNPTTISPSTGPSAIPTIEVSEIPSLSPSTFEPTLAPSREPQSEMPTTIATSSSYGVVVTTKLQHYSMMVVGWMILAPFLFV
mmetsp:Transcript_8460/g.12966  ORF Transcript_8460/g.12966 Transcript_8460/m.12966 type:complete len:644 (-) Transcript_8460:468-2399(-)|eukprot:CAMPEP_0195297402 /NCGR_PEP_ID=MMETSP0707-20130614/21433_1 /TAXON_ID=33640 /ORGANISM="Asterionellopsis glacialis, Strain CCMP134" /LENGTH=643 /DNA_ID=CAMNT_0040359199 /DNA_START=54 /DNA_END=1988 /DNA_ORIENTATION=-